MYLPEERILPMQLVDQRLHWLDMLADERLVEEEHWSELGDRSSGRF